MKPGLIELDSNYILFSVLVFIWLVSLWENYLTFRQVSTFFNPTFNSSSTSSYFIFIILIVIQYNYPYSWYTYT